MMPYRPPLVFVDGGVKCPSCHRKRPMADLVGKYDSATDNFNVKGIACESCGFKTPENLVGLVHWGAWIPDRVRVISELTKPICPFCGSMTVEVNDGHDERTFTYHRCPHSPLVYRMVVG